MRCPSCEARLVEVDRAGIEIDACPQCRGVWLDRGELDKILVKERELAAGTGADEDFFREMGGRKAPASPPPTEHGHGGGHGQGYDKRKKRKRSFLEDLLDFD